MNRLLLMLVVCGLTACATPAQRYSAAIARTHVDTLRTARSQTELQRVLESADVAQSLFAQSCVVQHTTALACRESCGYRACSARWANLSSGLETLEVMGASATPDSGTNNQESGVDEGGLAKRSGDYLFILRDDVLHVLRVSHNGDAVLEYTSRLSVLDAGEKDEAWYDEILVHDRDVILVGYNYREDVSELLHFRLDANDRLARLGRYAIRSSDYFSGENYATRIIGDDLVFVLSMPLKQALGDAWPSWTRRDASTPEWRSLLEPDDVFLPLVVAEHPVLSMVLECPIAEGLALERCRARAVIAPDAGTHYVTGNAVYLAVSEWPPEFYRDVATSVMDFDRYWAARHQRWTSIYRFPFGAERSVAVARIDGEIEDQFQLKEREGVLFAAGELMDDDDRDHAWAEVRLRRIAPSDFSPRPATLAPLVSSTRRESLVETMRFDEERLWISFELDDGKTSELVAAPLSGATSSVRAVDFAVFRLQPVGASMIAMNSWGEPATIARVRAAGASLQVDARRLPGFEIDAARSQAFNFRAMGDYGTLMTVPIDVSSDHYFGDTRRSDFAFLGLKDETLTDIGVLDMQAFGQRSSCANGCDDWYGNARAIPIDRRWIFLSGDLVLETALRDGVLQPVRSLLLMQDERPKP